ncbi:DUF7260 family protein [Halobacterium sp. KA-6]|uniref:DUF7260 family protein n=1 Tax=Halobacterium sp. KA-6 TaxID=2896368 RepID=UPI003FA5AE69
MVGGQQLSPVTGRGQPAPKVRNDEDKSVKQAQADLSQILSTLDTTVIPSWCRDTLTEQLNTIGEQRQQTLQRRTHVTYPDEFPLCKYLYGDQSWNYPVLTAIARLRETVTLEDTHTTKLTPFDYSRP